MGLTIGSTGKNAVDTGLVIQKERLDDRVVALAGNPNVGKSTVFNELTGLNQHTGNWPGKTVSNAQGRYEHDGKGYVLVDLPGTYSLLAHSAEEEVARDFICFGDADAVVVVCDATCLERNLNLVLQTIEITPNTIVCVNLMDEAKKKHIKVDTAVLEKMLGVPVVAASARSGIGLDELMKRVEEVCSGQYKGKPMDVKYPQVLESAIAIVAGELQGLIGRRISNRWLALRLLEQDQTAMDGADRWLGFPLCQNPILTTSSQKGRELMKSQGMEPARLCDSVTLVMIKAAEEAAARAVTFEDPHCNRFDRRWDKLLTSKGTGIPIMLLLLSVIFWLTISGANYPSQMLAELLFRFQDQLTLWFNQWGAPPWLHGALVLGVYRVAAWVVSVMLPPMTIFFPLFTLLEDLGYLPRVAFNLDHHFKKACACGKQSLTMCMGFMILQLKSPFNINVLTVNPNRFYDAAYQKTFSF